MADQSRHRAAADAEIDAMENLSARHREAEPARIEKYWISIPDQAFDAYNCGAPL